MFLDAAGVMQFNRRLLSNQAADVWGNPEKVQQYYQASLAADAAHHMHATDRLPRLNDEQTREYQKWTPFADVWDVCSSSTRPFLCSVPTPLEPTTCSQEIASR